MTSLFGSPRRGRRLLTAFLLGIALTSAVGSARAEPKRIPGCTESERHLLDYWVGDWDVFDFDDAHRQLQARARVDSVLAGCALHELYQQNDGLVGDSFLSYDSITKKWQQTWLTNFGGFMFLTGTFAGDALTLTGSYHTKTKDLLNKITWQRAQDGVRETGLVSSDGGGTWSVTFDVLFVKHKDKT